MQRGGNWDNSDVKGAKKIKWDEGDQKYDIKGWMKNQIGGGKLPW